MWQICSISIKKFTGRSRFRWTGMAIHRWNLCDCTTQVFLSVNLVTRVQNSISCNERADDVESLWTKNSLKNMHESIPESSEQIPRAETEIITAVKSHFWKKRILSMVGRLTVLVLHVNTLMNGLVNREWTARFCFCPYFILVFSPPLPIDYLVITFFSMTKSFSGFCCRLAPKLSVVFRNLCRPRTAQLLFFRANSWFLVSTVV